MWNYGLEFPFPFASSINLSYSSLSSLSFLLRSSSPSLYPSSTFSFSTRYFASIGCSI